MGATRFFYRAMYKAVKDQKSGITGGSGSATCAPSRCADARIRVRPVWSGGGFVEGRRFIGSASKLGAEKRS
jgi:hypothetical protein